MAHTAHSDPEQVIERFDSEEQIQQKANELTELIKSSKHFIAFTGAGISTSAGIPDFRGPEGAWTLKAQGKVRKTKTISTTQAIPTATHMSLLELQKQGYLKFLISQNCDGLHRRSGFPPDKIAELHGNSNLELCSQCGKEFLRDFSATSSYRYDVHDHRTGRNCTECGGELVDSIINFGESLPEHAIKTGFSNAEQSDLCLVLGSSLTVRPACDMPKTVGKKKQCNLVICNLQNTPLDSYSSLRVYSKTDQLMQLVMKNLNLTIPPFILHRCVKIEVEVSGNTSNLKINAVDSDGSPYTLFPGITVNGERLEKEPFEHSCTGVNEAEVVLYFMGHYNEPPVKLNVPLKENLKQFYVMGYNPMNGHWDVQNKGEHMEFIKVARRVPTELQKIPAKIQQKPKINQATGFSVHPKEDCPHFGSQIKMNIASLLNDQFNKNTCHTCKDQTENWMCLNCGETFCSRYVKGDAKQHFKDSGHTVAISFSDISIWCYSCDDYITHPLLTGIIQQLQKAKFG